MADNDEKRRLRDEVAELARTVDGLRQELALSRAGHACHGSPCCVATMSHVHCNWGHCWCYTVHVYYQAYPVPGCAGGALPLIYTTNIGADVPFVTTNAAAGAAAGGFTTYIPALGN